ncbi:hypothetical protein CGK32_08505 [Vibrio parahaemolyticus]|nr:hypothetical protein CGK32_08505 [Vibrio parahaemolyticus]
MSLIAPTVEKLSDWSLNAAFAFWSKRLRLGDRMIEELPSHFIPFFTFLQSRSVSGYFIVNQSA